MQLGMGRLGKSLRRLTVLLSDPLLGACKLCAQHLNFMFVVGHLAV